MATAISIAIRNEKALERLSNSLTELSNQLGVNPPTIPTEYRSLAELPTMQLEEIAAWADIATKSIKEGLHDAIKA